MSATFSVRDRVQLSRAFLKRIGARADDSSWFKVGTVFSPPRQLGDNVLVKVQWDDGTTSTSQDYNLVHVSRLHLEPV